MKALNPYKKIKQTLGFTLTELLIVMGILFILSGFGFVAVVRYQRTLKLTELDGQAKQIFIAAQNHLSQSKASGELRRYVENTDGENLTGTLGYEVADVTDGSSTETLRYVIFNANAVSTDNAGNVARELMLPFGAVDEQMRAQGSYVIGYNPVTGIVRNVLFTDNGVTAGISFESYRTNAENSLFTGARDTNLGMDFYQNREARMKYGSADSRKGTGLVGYYDGSDIVDPGHISSVPAFRIVPHNDEVLTLEFIASENGTPIDFTKSDCPYQINLVLRGAHQDASKSGVSFSDVFKTRTERILGDGRGNSLVLDDIRASDHGNLHFVALLSADSGITPGDDLLIHAELVRRGELSDIATASAEVNSLFANYRSKSIFVKNSSGIDDPHVKIKKGDTEVAEIANIRHLQNLSDHVSAFAPGFILGTSLNIDGTTGNPYFEADQIANLTFGAGGSIFQSTTVLTESGQSGHTRVSQPGTVFSLNPGYAITYKGIGTTNEINDFRIIEETLSSGLFGSLHRSVTIENLVLNNLYVKGAIAGGLIGEVKEIDAKTLQIHINDVLLKSEQDNHKISAVEGHTAGGFIGHIDTSGYLVMENCASTAYVYADGASNGAGGLIGHLEKVKTDVLANSGIIFSYVGGHTKTVNEEIVYGTETTKVNPTVPSDAENHVNVVASNGIAGGFIGRYDLGSAITLLGCYSTASVYGKEDASAFMPHTDALDPFLSYVYGIGYVGKEGEELHYAPYHADLANLSDGDTLTTTAKPYNADLAKNPPVYYPYKSVSQIAKYYMDVNHTTGFVRASSRNLTEKNAGVTHDVHVGDWITQRLDAPVLRFENGNRLYANIYYSKDYTGPITMVLDERPTDSEHSFDRETEKYVITVDYTKETAEGVIGENGIQILGPKSSSVPLPVNRSITTIQGKNVRKLSIALDDITLPNTHFADISTLRPGASINGFASIEANAATSADTSWIRNAGYDTPLSQDELAAFGLSMHGTELSGEGNGSGSTSGDVDPETGLERTCAYDWTNSLFASCSNEEARYPLMRDTDSSSAVTQPEPEFKQVDHQHTALIATIRHLQNLDPEISGMDSNAENPYLITKAKQLKNLDWTAFKTNLLGDSADELKITKANGADATKKGQFYGIANAQLISYEGVQDLTGTRGELRFIEHLRINQMPENDFDLADFQQNAGLFRCIPENTDPNATFSIKNIGLRDAQIYGSNAGGFVGFSDNQRELSFENLYVEDSAVFAHFDAGGILGRALGNDQTAKKIRFKNVVVRDRHQDNRNLNLEDSGVLIYSDGGNNTGIENESRELSRNAGSVGGIVGKSLDAETSFENCLVYGRNFRVVNHYEFGKRNDDVDSSAGGLAGTLKYAKYTLKNCGASVYVYAPKGDCAGGLVGDFSPDTESSVENCYAGGLTSRGKPHDLEHVSNEMDVFLPVTAISMEEHASLKESTLNAQSFQPNHEGGYNIYGNLTSGGLFGYVGDRTRITDCFTTNSVGNRLYAIDFPPQGTSYTGGFIGRLWSNRSGATFDVVLRDNYSAGRVYDRNEDETNTQCGSFIGAVNKDFIYDENNENRSTRNYCLLGVNYNIDGKIVGIVNDAANATYNDNLVNRAIVSVKQANSAEMRASGTKTTQKTTRINRTKDDYPYKNTVTVGIRNHQAVTEKIEFHGDWEDPALSAENGNRLEMHYDAPFIKNHIYDWMIKVTGVLSGEVKYFGLHFVTGENANIPLTVQSYQNASSHTVGYRLYECETTYQLGDAFSDNEGGRTAYNKQDLIDFQITEQGIHLNFMFDDLTRKRGHFATSFPKFYPGEDLKIQMINIWKDPDTATEQEKENSGYDEFIVNSLFDSVQKINSVTRGGQTINNYVAYIGNSRHLLNLDRTLSEAGTAVAGNGDFERYYNSFNARTHTGWPRIYGAEQIDNIIFRHETDVPDVAAYTDPFIDEIKRKTSENGTLTIYSTWETVDVTGDHLKPIHPRYLRYYNGNNYIIENANIVRSNSETNVGLFTKVEPSYNFNNWESGDEYHLSIENLILKNLTVATDTTNAAGIVAEVTNGAKLQLRNININGAVTITGSNTAGGLVGKNDGETLIHACTYQPDSGYILATNGDGWAGGILGASGNDNAGSNKVTIEDIVFHPLSFYTIQGNQYAGGLAGNVKNGQKFEAYRNQVYGSRLIVKAMGVNSWDYAAGGLIGQIQNINDVSIHNSMASAYVTTKGHAAGGFIGIINNCSSHPGGIMLRNCYASGHTSNGKNGQYGTIDLVDANNGNELSADTKYVNTYSANRSGGFIGYYESTVTNRIENCFSTASASGGNNSEKRGVGGFIGYVNNSLELSNCYSAGYVKPSENARIGSFIGYVADNQSVIISSGSQYIGSLEGLSQNTGLQPVGNREEYHFSIPPVQVKAGSPVSHNESYDASLSQIWYPYQSECIDPKKSSTDPDSRSFIGDWPDQGIYLSEAPQNTLTQSMALSQQLSSSQYAATRTMNAGEESALSNGAIANPEIMETEAHIPDQILELENRPKLVSGKAVKAHSSPGT